MADHDSNKDARSGLKSAGEKPRMRSRGFLSHGGMPLGEGDAEVLKRSRGMHSHDAVNEQTPRELAPPEPRRPYRLEDK